MKILVTGAAGFIGRHLVPRLSDRHQVLAVVRRESPSNGADSVMAIDLARPLDTKALPEEIDVIIHLAQADASFPEGANELLAVNSASTQQLLSYGKRVGARRFILASTGDVYGRRLGPCKETDPIAPASYYAVTKQAAETFTQAYSGYFQTCILRFFHPYGPAQSGRLIPALATAIEQRVAVCLHQDDRPNLTPIYIDDVVTAVERAVESSYSGVVNVAGDQVVSIRQLAGAIGSVLKTKPLFDETGEEVADLTGDNKLMKEVFGAWPLTTLGDGLLRTFKTGRYTNG